MNGVYEKKYKCPQCQLTSGVIRKAKRGHSIRYLCKDCKRYFSISTIWSNTNLMLSDHLDGLSFRDLARKYHVSPMKAWRICQIELKKFPNNNQFTFNYCSQFSSTLVVDGKYISVSGIHDWVLLWGIDYFRHDIPMMLVAPSESYHAWAKYFFYFRIINHYPELLVCDDNQNIKLAARKNFPSVKIQTCSNHFKENIRRNLKVRSDDKYVSFMRNLEQVVGKKLSDSVMDKKLFSIFQSYQADPVAVASLTQLARYRQELTNYRKIKGSPMTTNIMEGLNSHLEERLVGINSFQSSNYAKLWLNGYVLKRRFTKMTDCRGKFKRFNGKNMGQNTQKPGIDLPILF